MPKFFACPHDLILRISATRSGKVVPTTSASHDIRAQMVQKQIDMPFDRISS